MRSAVQSDRPTLPADAQNTSTVASGLEWNNAGAAEPKKGTPLQNEKLAEALKKKTKFTKQEWGPRAGLRKLVAFYSIPMVIFLLRSLIEFAVIGLYLTCMLDMPTHLQLQQMRHKEDGADCSRFGCSDMPDFRPVEYVLFVLEWSILLDNIYNRLKERQSRLQPESSRGKIILLERMVMMRHCVFVGCVPSLCA